MNTAALLTLIAIAEADAGIPPGLLRAICTVESNLNPDAVVENDGKSGRASIGLCQIQLQTAAQFRPGISREELFSPATNARIGGEILAYHYRRYGSFDRAVVAYNRGSSSGGVNSYHRKVMKEYYGRNQTNQGSTDSGHSRGQANAAGSGEFLRQDYAHASENWTYL